MKHWQAKHIVAVTAVLVIAAGAGLLIYNSGRKAEPVWTVPVTEGVAAPLAEAGKTPPAPLVKEGEIAALTATPAPPKPEEAALPGGRKPRIAIVIDDMGQNAARSKKAITLPPAVTLSFLPYTSDVAELTEQARAAGHELLLHMPMEPIGREDPGPDALLTGLAADEIRARLNKALDSFKGYDGINNHMGSKFTANREGMDTVMSVLKERNLFYFDSMTSGKSIGIEAARAQQVPAAKRDVFLDNNISAAAVKARLAEAEKIARKNGQATAIGHPNPVLIQTLEKWIPEAEKNGFVIVPVRDLVR